MVQYVWGEAVGVLDEFNSLLSQNISNATIENYILPVRWIFFDF